MKDRGLLVIALVWSLVGIFLLILAALFAEPEHISIDKLGDNLGKTIIVSGTITRSTYLENVAFIDIYDETGKALIVLFKEPAYKPDLGDVIAVKGKVQLYKDELEVVADEIICVACGNDS
ncbi:MAG: OB-fold nucleic acid binding domain-containing protein [Candidatus Nanoarchaeia archaeon]